MQRTHWWRLGLMEHLSTHIHNIYLFLRRLEMVFVKAFPGMRCTSV